MRKSKDDRLAGRRRGKPIQCLLEIDSLGGADRMLDDGPMTPSTSQVVDDPTTQAVVMRR
jgi:hypothetical protein